MTYQAYVAVELPSNYGQGFQSFYVMTTPGDGWQGPFTIYLNGTPDPFQTGTQTDPNGFSFAFSAYSNGAYPTSIPPGGYSLNPSQPTLYYLTVTTVNNEYDIVTLTPAETKTQYRPKVS